MIGYAVTHKPTLASYRLRVAIPSEHLGVPSAIGACGSPTFFYKLGNPEVAAHCDGVVFDVVNDHFDMYPTVRAMTLMADQVTVGSRAMADIVRMHTGRDSIVIDDPYENDEHDAAVIGDRVLWFGHSINLPSLNAIADQLRGYRMTICTDYQHPSFVPWSLAVEQSLLSRAAVVVLTGTNPGASSNRIAKAIRAGRFVVTPGDCAESWRQFRDYAWVGDVREGVRWALNNREDACKKIRAGQQYVREHFAPDLIGRQWRAVFDSISVAGTAASKVSST